MLPLTSPAARRGAGPVSNPYAGAVLGPAAAEQHPVGLILCKVRVRTLACVPGKVTPVENRVSHAAAVRDAAVPALACHCPARYI
jgi:hypothetical protein